VRDGFLASRSVAGQTAYWRAHTVIVVEQPVFPRAFTG
jgi:hypothetical protein